MDCGAGCVDANVANSVDDVANTSPIGMDCGEGCVNANVANPVDNESQCVANRNGLWWGLRRCQCRHTRWQCCQCVANRNGLWCGLRRCQCRQPRCNVANASPIGMDCSDANVANPVDDVANVSPIGMDCGAGCVDANVANPVDDVANASPIGLDCVELRRCQCRQPRWRCCQCVANRIGLWCGLRRCQCRQPRWRCCQCVANRNGLCRAASMPMSPTPLTMLPMRRQ